jgi:hypothetical protein
VRPITFSCSEMLVIPPERIAGQILDLDRWPEFRGYGVLPGIGESVDPVGAMSVRDGEGACAG